MIECDAYTLRFLIGKEQAMLKMVRSMTERNPDAVIHPSVAEQEGVVKALEEEYGRRFGGEDERTGA